ncbi:hypothetical protein RB596_006386 [Gaeumannomyces avenae]
MSWDLLQRFLDSDVFNSNPFLSVSYLSRYADHVGIHYVLCNKLRQFPYEDIEFFLPQLCHLIISVDNESMALEEFLLDLCEESVTAALLTFWLFQTYLYDLSSNPQAEAFKTCRRVYNKVQHIVFGLAEAGRHEKIKENILPVMVLGSFILASIGVPGLAHWAGPLAVAQGRKPQPAVDLVPEHVSQPQNKVTRSHTINTTSTTSRSKRPKDSGRITSALDPPIPAVAVSPGQPKSPMVPKSRPSSSGGPRTPADPEGGNGKRPSQLEMLSAEGSLSSSSLPLPELRSPRMQVTRPATPVSAGLRPSEQSSSLSRRHSHHVKKALAHQAEMSSLQKVRLLRQNYFRCQTAFLTALEDISNRLVIVPKPARLSALRAELALITQDLPAEVDIPVICPPTLVNGSPGRSKHHRIVRVNPAEATVLNSAEKVPYLVMVEILRDDFTFDPDSQENQRLLSTLLAEQGSRKRIFDLSESPRGTPTTRGPGGGLGNQMPVADSVFEPTAGDLGSSPMIRPFDEEDLPADGGNSGGGGTGKEAQGVPQRISSSATTLTTLSDPTPRSSATSTSRSSSPRRKTGPPLEPTGMVRSYSHNLRTPTVEQQPDFSALATHMRAASQMLAQLEATSGKRPKHEVAAIRAKIIASMQSLEEQSFDLDDGNGPTFDLIMAKASAAEAAAVAATNGAGGGAGPDADDETVAAAAAAAAAGLDGEANAGEARMENDFKTGGLQRKGDRDDPSAAVFGEAWQAKKERIRRTSPYGWMKNWDLISVIVKTGADLRQEAFACQLIQVCHRIWIDAKVNVWVKMMRILVTGESSGLIETITNGVSLHSIKRSLTLAAAAEAAAGGPGPAAAVGATTGTSEQQGPLSPAPPPPTSRRSAPRIATLKDHFLKAFGPETGDAYKAGVDAFKRSLAAYSVISYVLQLKDRHNGNVLIDSEGHIIHIDFGFMLSNSPGSVGFEAAPFKFTAEYLEVLGGVGSPEYDDFKRLCKQAFQALRRSADKIIDLVAMMGRDSKMPCFGAGVTQTTNNLRQRFQLQLSADEAEQFVETDMIGKSLGSYYTRLYDTFQYRTQGIY